MVDPHPLTEIVDDKVQICCLCNESHVFSAYVTKLFNMAFYVTFALNYVILTFKRTFLAFEL